MLNVKVVQLSILVHPVHNAIKQWIIILECLILSSILSYVIEIIIDDLLSLIRALIHDCLIDGWHLK